MTRNEVFIPASMFDRWGFSAISGEALKLYIGLLYVIDENRFIASQGVDATVSKAGVRHKHLRELAEAGHLFEVPGGLTIARYREHIEHGKG